MSEYFSTPKYLGTNLKIKLDLPTYATKADLKNATEKTDLSILKSDLDKLDIGELKNVPSGLSNLRTKIDKLDIRKLETTPVDLSKLNDIVKNEVLKRTEYKELVK